MWFTGTVPGWPRLCCPPNRSGWSRCGSAAPAHGIMARPAAPWGKYMKMASVRQNPCARAVILPPRLPVRLALRVITLPVLLHDRCLRVQTTACTELGQFLREHPSSIPSPTRQSDICSRLQKRRPARLSATQPLFPPFIPPPLAEPGTTSGATYQSDLIVPRIDFIRCLWGN